MQHHLYTSFLRLPLMLRVLFIALIVILTFGVFIHLLEPGNFPTLIDGIWWAVITASTVGYGDFVPETLFGRITGIMLILFGAGLLSTFFVTLSSEAVTKQNAHLEGKAAFKGERHIIVVGWNERSRGIIDHLSKRQPSIRIILIDETLESNPMPHQHLHFIKGRTNRDEVWERANILLADKVIITAEQNKDELQADMATILTLLTIKGVNPAIRCIVEILTSEQVSNARRAGADEIIQTNVIASSVMLTSLASEGTDIFIPQLQHTNGCKLAFQPVNEKITGLNFLEASSLLLTAGTLLIGVKRGEETIMNPSHPFKIIENDRLVVIENQ